MKTLLAAALLSLTPAAADAASLSPEDLDAARIAWRYFERNYQPGTGLVNSVEAYASTSAWDLGSSLIATIAARQLLLVDAPTFDTRISAALRTLETQPLFRGTLPNKAYDAATGAMTDYAKRPVAGGIGWSALDIGRLASALHILARFHPEHRDAVSRVLERWQYCDLVGAGELHGAMIAPSGEVAIVQEGRFGYEQYAAHALERLGFDLPLARRYDRFVAHEEIFGVRVRRDTRDQRTFHAVDALATEPWVLDTLEFGATDESRPLVRSMFDVQKRRWEVTGVPTAASEDHVDRAPWFVYGGVWAAGKAWHAVTPTGSDAGELSGVSTKAAFALAALHPDDPYASVLRGTIANARDPQRGWFAGVYDRGGVNRALTANTNGVILETLLWKAVGPLHGVGARPPAPARGSCKEASIARGAASEREPAIDEPAPSPAASRESPFTVAPPRERGSRRRALRLDGSVFGGYRGADRATAGGVATLWLWGSSFVRIGGEATPHSQNGTARLLWGIGYDDWRDNTFFMHVDNWGPVRPQDGLAIRQAEFTAGYKLPRLCLSSSFCMSPLTSVVAPFVGGPYLHARMTVTVARAWFVMGGIGWTVPGVIEGPLGTPDWRVVYGFGRADWRPGGIFVTYHDWGPDSRSGNGIVAAGVNWGF